MAIKFFDGMGCYKSVAELAAAKNGIISGGASVQTTGGRFGGGCIFAGPIGSNPLTLVIASALNAPIYIGAAMNFERDNSTFREFMRFISSGSNTMCQLGGNTASGQLFVNNKSGTTLAYSSGAPLTPNVWHWLEVRFVPGSTTSNGSLAVHVDGEEVLNVTGADFNRGTETLARMFLGGYSNVSNSARVDDLVIWDETGTDNTWLGDLRIDELVPTSNGSDQDWTQNTGIAWDAVDDVPASPDDDTTHIAASTVGAKSSFGVASLAGTSAKIMGVKVRARAKKTDAGTRTMKTLMKSGAVEVQDAVGVDPTTAYTSVHGDMKLLNPDTSAAWDVAAVNALKIGVALAT
ncbi:hypothetical protein [Hyphomicrobium sp. ghe19]|uniref:hypothetical protein n=1 Tax=Hyphomicrobium sp. ghe19 TaxID=2682968 RepID=UPI001366DE18|nr:hypothetical protein HYPP_02485 [Hyphomicrobium sp. ghe19]